MKILLKAVLAAGVMSAAIGIEAPYAQEIQLKASLFPPPSNPLVKAMDKWAEEMKAKSDGRLVIKVFPASQMGPPPQQFDLARTGVADFEYAKANPNKVNVSSPGVGSISHLAGELFKMMTGVEMVHVPFSGNSPALTALLGGQVEVSIASLPSSIEFIRSGKLRGLAVTSTKRVEVLPDVPAVVESVPGYEVSAWYGVGAPKGTPNELIDKLNNEINASLADPKLKARIGDFGGTVFALSPAGFGKFIADETEKWAKVIRAANIKPA